MKTIRNYTALVVGLSLFAWNYVHAAPSALQAGKMKNALLNDLQSFDLQAGSIDDTITSMQNLLTRIEGLKYNQGTQPNGFRIPSQDWSKVVDLVESNMGIVLNAQSANNPLAIGDRNTPNTLVYLLNLIITNLPSKEQLDTNKINHEAVYNVLMARKNTGLIRMLKGLFIDAIDGAIEDRLHVQAYSSNPQAVAQALQRVNNLIRLVGGQLALIDTTSAGAAAFQDAYLEFLEVGGLYSAYQVIADDVQKRLKSQSLRDGSRAKDAQQCEELLAQEKGGHETTKGQLAQLKTISQRDKQIIEGITSELGKIPPMYRTNQNMMSNSLVRQVNALVSEFKETKRDLAAEKDVLSLFQNANTNLKIRLQSFGETNLAMQRTLAQKNIQKDVLENQLAQLQDEIQKLQGEVGDFENATFKSLQQENKQLRDQVESLRRTNEILQADATRSGRDSGASTPVNSQGDISDRDSRPGSPTPRQ